MMLPHPTRRPLHKVADRLHSVNIHPHFQHFPCRFVLFLICALAANLHAQLGVKLDLDREHYILYEPIQATIQLRNYAGNTLVFGTEDAAEEVGGYLKFEVIRAGGLSAPDVRKNVNPVENLIL
ncbi:MAG: hypothetical protein ACOC0L_01970, partial [bacterium]